MTAESEEQPTAVGLTKTGSGSYRLPSVYVSNLCNVVLALAHDPDRLILDAPVASLDSKTRCQRDRPAQRTGALGADAGVAGA